LLPPARRATVGRVADTETREAGEVLLAWYRAHGRDLPWRHTHDPWAVWVSEVMLQQTRVETAAPYWERFLARFPDPAALASADEQDVLAAWAGLGYYRRARHLHRAARQVVELHGGEVPGDRAAFVALPGVGPYTAGAVLSIAFGLPEPAVDGNVARVLARLRCLDGDPAASDQRRRLREAAAALLGSGPAGDVNQALMDLGAQVCTPGEPDCGRCPLAERCEALREGRQAELPRPAARTPVRPVRVVAAALLDDAGRLLVARRPPDGLLAGMWELPGGEHGPRESPAAAVRRALRERIEVRVAAPNLEPAGRVTHVFTHRRWDLRVFRGRRWEGEPRAVGYPELRWVDPAAPGVPLPGPTEKVLALLRRRSPR